MSAAWHFQLLFEACLRLCVENVSTTLVANFQGCSTVFPESKQSCSTENFSTAPRCEAMPRPGANPEQASKP